MEISLGLSLSGISRKGIDEILDPLEILGTDLGAWYDGTQGVSLETGVSGWDDQGLSGFHLTQTNTINQPSRPDTESIGFDGSSLWWLEHVGFNALFGLNNYTVLALLNTTVPNVAQRWLFYLQTQISPFFFEAMSIPFGMPNRVSLFHRVPYNGALVDNTNVDDELIDDVDQIIIGRRSIADDSHRAAVDDVSQSTAPVRPALTSEAITLRVGIGRLATTGPFLGELKQLIFVKRAITAAEETQLAAFLNNKKTKF